MSELWLALLQQPIPEPIQDRMLLNTIGWITAILSTVIGIWASRRKNKAEIQKIATESEVSIAKVAMEFVEVQKRDLADRNKDYELLKKHTTGCEEELRQIKRTQEHNKSRLDRLEAYVRNCKGPIIAEELQKILRAQDR